MVCLRLGFNVEFSSIDCGFSISGVSQNLVQTPSVLHKPPQQRDVADLPRDLVFVLLLRMACSMNLLIALCAVSFVCVALYWVS
jgi:hypothetical protein